MKLLYLNFKIAKNFAENFVRLMSISKRTISIISLSSPSDLIKTVFFYKVKIN